jgi:hypothetical protein
LPVLDGTAGDGLLRARGAVCVPSRGRVLVATVRHRVDAPLVETLKTLGCRLIAALDRGSHDAAFVHRTKTPLPPLDRYPMSVVYALGAPLKPSAYHWQPRASDG